MNEIKGIKLSDIKCPTPPGHAAGIGTCQANSYRVIEVIKKINTLETLLCSFMAFCHFLVA